MDRLDQLERENAALRDRLSRLGEASLSINESLDLDAVLQGALDSARSLTGARYGVMTLLDDAGQIQDFLSSAMTAEEARRIWDTPGGLRIFEYLNGLQEPLRIPDLLGLLSSLGLPEFQPPASVGRVLSFLAAPVFHRGERVGNIFVADREEGDEFTSEDESTLVMFASQAALVIANARRYREEQRARAGLETLINTSPVGVVVFNSRAENPVSYNREARRIVDALRDPDQSPEQLLEVITLRRGDGRRVSLAELPLVRALSEAETVRAEDIVLEVADGRSVPVLINATPIRDEGGEVESFVVTLQDMTRVDETDRLRADFLAMVSHELRMPLSSIKGSAATVLSSPHSLEPAEVVQFFKMVNQQADRMHELIRGLLDVARIRTGTLSLDSNPIELISLIEEAGRAFASRGRGNSLDVGLPADLPWVMADRGRIVQVLGHLLSSAAVHSSERSPIRVTAEREGVHVAVSVVGEGLGISPGMLPHLFGNSSRTGGGEQSGNAAGPELGLAVCKGIVEGHGGRIKAEGNGLGFGARFTFTLPAVEPGMITGPAGPSAPAARRHLALRAQLRILAADDDPQTLRIVREVVTNAGYSLTMTGDPNDMPRLLEDERPDLVLLDLASLGSDEAVRMGSILETSDVPVILLSTNSDEEVIDRAFDMGAADYLVKPFSPTELAARIRVALHRQAGTRRATPSLPYTLGNLTVDYGERRVTVAEREVELTDTEFQLLRHLSMADGQVVTHDQLLQRNWRPERRGEPWLVRNVVKRLRRKLGDDAENPKYIFTKPRVGYRMPRGDESN